MQDIKSLDEDDNEEVKIQVPKRTKKERKSYTSCERATANGLRCLNIKKHATKIGLECRDFCETNFTAALEKLFVILLGRVLIPQEDTLSGTTFNDEGNRKFGNLHYLKINLFFDHEIEIYDKNNAHIGNISKYGDRFVLSLSFFGSRFIHLSLVDVVTKLMEFIHSMKNIILCIRDHTIDRIDYGNIPHFILGKYNQQTIKVPVDEITLNNNDVIDPDAYFYTVQIFIRITIPLLRDL